jgi:hypothetical protein
MQGQLPPRIVQRRKMGFPPPRETMFRGELFDYARDRLKLESDSMSAVP